MKPTRFSFINGMINFIAAVVMFPINFIVEMFSDSGSFIAYTVAIGLILVVANVTSCSIDNVREKLCLLVK